MGPRDFARWLIAQRARLRAEGQVATQEEIAKRAGLSRSTIAMIEAMAQPGNRESCPERDTVIALARAVRVSETEALAIAGYASPEMLAGEEMAPPVAEVADSLRRLTPGQLETVRRLVEEPERLDAMRLLANQIAGRVTLALIAA